jgi:hypothetical protein
MENLNKHIGDAISTKQLSNLSEQRFFDLADRAFITVFHSDTWEQLWFPILLNKRHMKFDAEITMEFCREMFGHTSFGIASGKHARMGCSVRDNL